MNSLAARLGAVGLTKSSFLQDKPTARSVCNPDQDRIDFRKSYSFTVETALQNRGAPDLAGCAALLVTRCNQYSPEHL